MNAHMSHKSVHFCRDIDIQNPGHQRCKGKNVYQCLTSASVSLSGSEKDELTTLSCKAHSSNESLSGSPSATAITQHQRKSALSLRIFQKLPPGSRHESSKMDNVMRGEPEWEDKGNDRFGLT